MVRPRWGDNARTDLAEATDAVVLFPVGAVEQHGPHLPVDTDASIAAAIANAAAERADDALALPPLPYGYSPHHGGVPGTLSLSSETYLRTVKDLLASLDDDGFDQAVVVNGHGGNRALLQTAVTDLTAEREYAVAVISYWDLIHEEIKQLRESGQGGVSHGGEMETSLQLYLREELVGADREDFVRDDRRGYLRTDLFGSGPVYYPGHFDDKTESGVSGHPSAASKEKGERLFEAATDALARFADEYREW